MYSCLDNFSGSFEQKVTQLYQQWRQNRGNISEEKFNSSHEYDLHYDFTSSLTKKRVSATVAYQSFLQKELGDIASSELLNDMFAFSNGMILRGGYTNFDISFSVIVASAIWILDQLKLQGDLEKIYPYLPLVPDDEKFTFVHHPQYSEDLIESVTKLICDKDEDDYNSNVYLSILPVSKRNSSPRKAYDAVISLIDQNAIDAVKEKYERKIWEFYRLVFESYVKIQDEKERIEKEIESLQKSAMLSYPTLMQNSNKLFASNDAITEKIQRLNYQLERIENTAWYTEIGLPDSREKTARRFRNIIGEDMVSKLTNFSVDDPFEYAFALHILLDEDSLIPWLYYGSICLTYTFVDQLPFVNEFVQKGNPKLIDGANRILYTHKFKGVRWKNRTDCNGEAIERTFGKNLGQILYYSSHTLYPRVADEMPELDTFFNDLSLDNEDEKQVYSLIIHLLGSTTKEQESLQTYRLNREIEKITEENSSLEIIDTTDLEKKTLILEDRVNALSRALYEEGRLKKNAISKNNQLTIENERLIRELADLRELVFMQQSDEPIEIETKEEIKFPIETAGRIISFGGHPSWINEMKKLLPNVIFYSPEVIPNKDAIKNADQVWVQTQCISHSAFYRVVSSLNNETQIRYFTSKSARNCAEQLIIKNNL